MASLGELIVRIGADASKFERDMQRIERKVQRMGRNLTDIGRRLTTGLTAPLAGMAAGALKASVDFESAFAGVRKTVDATETELAGLRQGILDMSAEIPAAATDIAAVAEAAGQLGIQTEHILGFTRVMIDLGNATNLSGEEAATALARLANITQMSQDEFDRLGSTIVALGNNLATTEAEIVEMGLRLAGAGSQVGLTEAQILAFAGALSSVGIAAEAGGSAFSKVMIDIASQVEMGGEKLARYAEVAGMSAEEFAASWREDAAGALVAFIEGLGRLGAEGESVFLVLEELEITEVRMRDALLRAAGAGDLFRESLELGTKAWEENAALTAEASQRYETTESKLNILWNRIKEVAITLGDALMPAFHSALDALEPLIDAISRAADWFANLDPKAQQIIITVGGLAAAIGPLLVVLGTLISSASALAPLLGALVSPWGLIAAAIAGLVIAGKEVIEHWDEIKEAANKLKEYVLDAIQRMVEGVTNWFRSLKDKAAESVRGLVDGVTGWFGDMYHRIVGGSIVPDLVTETIAWFDRWAAESTGIVAIMAADIGDVIDRLGDSMRGSLTGAFDDILAGTASFSEGMTSVLSAMGDTIRRILAEKLAQAAMDSLSTLGTWALGALSRVAAVVAGFIQQAYASLLAFFAWSGPAAPALAAGVIAAGTASMAALASKAKGLIGLERGGIITGPTIALMGEKRRREAVIPLERDNVIADSVGDAVLDAMLTAQRMQAAAGPSGGSQEVVLRLDGQTFARLILPSLVREGQRQGMDVVLRPA